MSPLTTEMRSNVQWLLSQPEPVRTAALRSLTASQAEALVYDWGFWAREKQLPPPGDWTVWLYMAGRGTGKTRTFAEWIKAREAQGYRRFFLVGQTPADVRDVMIEGESGILSCYPSRSRPTYEPTKRRLTWPSGATALAFSGANPEQLRGPQGDTCWVDELAAFDNPAATWNNLRLAVRLSDNPRIGISTTPKPLSLLREIRDEPSTVLVTESTYANKLNLSEAFFRGIVARYEGTRTGRQEIHAELLDESEFALWKRSQIEALRVREAPQARRIVIGVDPAAQDTQDSSETGIIVAMLGRDGHGYVLADLSGHYSPEQWGRRVVEAFHRWNADNIIVEANNGGLMCQHVIRTVWPQAPVKLVHASHSKQARSEPVASLYELGRVHHVGMFPELEDQQVSWEPLSGDKSPDRVDALTWALTELMLTGVPPIIRGETKSSTWRDR